MRKHKAKMIKQQAGSPGFSLVLIFMLTLLLSFYGCSKKQLLSKNSKRQHFVDVTKRYLPQLPGTIQRAKFARVNKDRFRDLILHVKGKGDGSRLLLLVNKGGRGFEIRKENISSIRDCD